MDTLIQVQDLHRHYRMGDTIVRAVNGVSFDVEKGEYLAIMGGSGSGKTTLMNMLGCLAKPTSGSYQLASRNVEHLTDDQLSAVRSTNVGFVFQSFQLLPKSSALKNVALPLVYQDVSPRERRKRAEQALARVGLSQRIKHRPSELSGGQRQRVAIARALITRPSLILADEPTGNLDSATARDILTLLSDLHERGHSILIVTHEAAIAAQCPRAIRMRDGVIVADGPGDQIAGATA